VDSGKERVQGAGEERKKKRSLPTEPKEGWSYFLRRGSEKKRRQNERMGAQGVPGGEKRGSFHLNLSEDQFSYMLQEGRISSQRGKKEAAAAKSSATFQLNQKKNVPNGEKGGNFRFEGEGVF